MPRRPDPRWLRPIELTGWAFLMPEQHAVLPNKPMKLTGACGARSLSAIR
jgi:hypothetical protein